MSLLKIKINYKKEIDIEEFIKNNLNIENLKKYKKKSIF
jgi:hypothetical protein